MWDEWRMVFSRVESVDVFSIAGDHVIDIGTNLCWRWRAGSALIHMCSDTHHSLLPLLMTCCCLQTCANPARPPQPPFVPVPISSKEHWRLPCVLISFFHYSFLTSLHHPFIVRSNCFPFETSESQWMLYLLSLIEWFLMVRLKWKENQTIKWNRL